SALGRNEEVVAQGNDFLAHFPQAPEQPEVRFYLSMALKQLNRNTEALQQVIMLLQEQKARVQQEPERWAYWQQRAGNEVANQLYHDGDYTKALDIYLALEQLNPQAAWQLPVSYQIGLTFERLAQPQSAARKYQEILQREPELGTNATAGLKMVF